MQHSKGPWKVIPPCTESFGLSFVQDSSGVSVCGVYRRIADGKISTDKQEANARLIAAAPDLLEAALELFVCLSDSGYNIDEDQIGMVEYPGWKNLRLAIKKAKGE